MDHQARPDDPRADTTPSVWAGAEAAPTLDGECLDDPLAMDWACEDHEARQNPDAG